MVTTFQEVLRPFFVTYFIVGLNIYPIRQPTSKITWVTCLSILYSLIIWFIYAYFYYYMVILFTWKILLPYTLIHLITLVVNILAIIVSVIMAFYHQERLKMCVKRLATVDDTLEQLGTAKVYRKLHIYSKQILIGWIVHIFIINFQNVLYNLRTERLAWTLVQFYIQTHCNNINLFIDLLLTFFLWYVGTRFDKVYEHMRYLMNEKHISKYKWQKSITLHRYVICADDYKRTLWILMHLHLELCRTARELNLIFGLQMTVEMASCIINIIIVCFGVNILLTKYRKEISLIAWFGVSYWILILIVRLWMINYSFERVRIKAEKIDKIFHQLTNIIRYADVWKEIYQFVLQAIQNPLKFTGMGFFYFGNSFLRKLCTTVLMYVIIMVQMKIRLF